MNISTDITTKILLIGHESIPYQKQKLRKWNNYRKPITKIKTTGRHVKRGAIHCLIASDRIKSEKME